MGFDPAADLDLSLVATEDLTTELMKRYPVGLIGMTIPEWGNAGSHRANSLLYVRHWGDPFTQVGLVGHLANVAAISAYHPRNFSKPPEEMGGHVNDGQ